MLFFLTPLIILVAVDTERLFSALPLKPSSAILQRQCVHLHRSWARTVERVLCVVHLIFGWRRRQATIAGLKEALTLYGEMFMEAKPLPTPTQGTGADLLGPPA